MDPSSARTRATLRGARGRPALAGCRRHVAPARRSPSRPEAGILPRRPSGPRLRRSLRQHPGRHSRQLMPRRRPFRATTPSPGRRAPRGGARLRARRRAAPHSGRPRRGRAPATSAARSRRRPVCRQRRLVLAGGHRGLRRLRRLPRATRQQRPRGAGHARQEGRPVYAVGDGTVWISRADTGGYGVGGKPGGCIIIVHRTGAGRGVPRPVRARVEAGGEGAGERVTPGQRIAVVNGLDHLHFGIHPSGTYRDRNPYAGEVPKKWKDHGGWVDPVKYLRANPRGASYAAPALPVVRIQTGATPADYRRRRRCRLLDGAGRGRRRASSRRTWPTVRGASWRPAKRRRRSTPPGTR